MKLNACYNKLTKTANFLTKGVIVMTLSKYHETEKEYLVFDSSKNAEVLTPELLRSFCSRNFGISSQGILVVSRPAGQSAPYKLLDFSGNELSMDKESFSVFEKYSKNIPPTNVIYYFSGQ